MLDKMKKLMELQKTAKKMQKEMESTNIDVEGLGGKLKMQFNGKMELKDLDIDESLLVADKKKDLTKAIKNCYHDALNKSQKIAQEALKDISGPMGFPGF